MLQNYKIIDLSVPLCQGIKSDPPMCLPKIKYVDHAEGAQQLVDFFPGLKVSDLPNNEGWAIEFADLCTHSGTHMDAPYHYGSRMRNGDKTMTIDEIPLEWCVGEGIKLDFRKYANGYVIQPQDIIAEMERINCKIKPGNIVLIQTSAENKYGKDDFLDSGCGVGREGTLFLVEKGVKIVGTNAWSWDAPFAETQKKYTRSKDARLIWEGHFAGVELPYCQIEKLNNLNLLPPTGFTVISLPIKLKKASGSWARPIALVNT